MNTMERRGFKRIRVLCLSVLKRDANNTRKPRVLFEIQEKQDLDGSSVRKQPPHPTPTSSHASIHMTLPRCGLPGPDALLIKQLGIQMSYLAVIPASC